jgi:hypothetical protein
MKKPLFQAAAVLAVIFVTSPAALAADSYSKIYRLYNVKTGEHFSTSSRAEMIANGCPSPGYTIEKLSYFLTDNGGSPGSTTVSRLYNPKTGDHLLSISSVEIGSALNAGYFSETPSAFLAHTTAQSGGTAIYRYFNVKTGDHLYSTSASELGAGYVSEGAVFYFSSAADVPVDRLYSPSRGDHFYTANPDETNAVGCLKPTYFYEGVNFRANTASAGGDVPVYRLTDPRGFHFLTASASEKDAAVSAGYKLEGTEFYAYTAAMGTYIPIYRLRNPRTGDHLYTMMNFERSNLAQGGYYIDEGVAFYAAGM